MKYQTKTKFLVAIDDVGNITPGAAVSGFSPSALTPDFTGGVYFCLIEDPATNAWELCQFKPDAGNASEKRKVMYSSDSGNFILSTLATGLTCSMVAHPNSYSFSTHEWPGGQAPDVRSPSSTGIGAGADVGASSQYSLAIGGTVRDNSPRSVAVGGTAGGAEAVSLGYEAETGDFTDNYSYATINTPGSVAIGYRARTTMAGEVALGSANSSHMSGVPVMTAPPEDGGTFLFQAVAGHDGSNYVLADIAAGAESYKPPYPASSPQWVIHVQGIIVARASSADDGKVIKVEWVTGGALTQTVLTQGANDISLGLALVGMRLQATVAATVGLKLSGYLHLTKVALPQ